MANPVVFFDIAASGEPLGRVTFEVGEGGVAWLRCGGGGGGGAEGEGGCRHFLAGRPGPLWGEGRWALRLRGRGWGAAGGPRHLHVAAGSPRRGGGGGSPGDGGGGFGGEGTKEPAQPPAPAPPPRAERGGGCGAVPAQGVSPPAGSPATAAMRVPPLGRRAARAR